MDEGGGSYSKMWFKLNYDHNHEVTSCDSWNFLEETKQIFWTLQECTLEFNKVCSSEEGGKCHDVPSLLMFSGVLRAMQRCWAWSLQWWDDTRVRYRVFRECSTEMKEETSEPCKDVWRKMCHNQPTEHCSTGYSEVYTMTDEKFGLESVVWI